MITDSATGLSGMLTHFQAELGGNRYYNFQPSGLNPEDGQPVKRLWLTEDRMTNAPTAKMVDLPLEVLGTEVADAASGFRGKATSVTLHSSGCVHVHVQPEGRLAKTGAAIESCDFDIRRLSGPAIPQLTEEQIERSEKKNPSPSATERAGPRAL